MEIIDGEFKEQEEKERVRTETKKSINKLVKKSFGILYNGDWYGGSCVVYGGSVDYRGKEINCIGRLNSIIGSRAKGAGKFLEKDGSKLEVLAKYFSKAKKYAELFEEKMGKPVSIIVLSNNAYEIPTKQQ